MGSAAIYGKSGRSSRFPARLAQEMLRRSVKLSVRGARMGAGMDNDRIVVGKPLPFSIFTADGKLLLAQGRIVESERLRDMLVRNGHHSELTEAAGKKGRGAGEREEEE